MGEMKQIKNLKDFSTSVERFQGGHRLCPGCSHGVIIREFVNATDDELCLSNATGCLEVCSTIYPFTSWNASWIHIGFENAAAAISGVEAMHKALKNKGKGYSGKEVKFVALGGDGGTYDIGFQSLSGAAERGHNFIYLCLDNEGYMNTGGQRSSSTPVGAATTTSPSGKVSYGEKKRKKDLVSIMSMHRCDYVAQVAPSSWKDLVTKAQKAYQAKGSVFINAMSPCPTEWKFDPALSMEVSKVMVDSCVCPLYEIEHNDNDFGYKLTITYEPKNKLPVRDYIAMQGRFKHLFKPENAHILDQWQKDIDAYWDYLRRRQDAGV
ncbi:MAG: pyruvate ferredoxin oxidoreductase [Helicobacteraceae bacterium]|jgi:pyruvate ferredoxin oxidoreductase beta subunit|nr:pyruvate ferredoxin oxidoreductase [Helicobacteraceae bacterium]